MRCSMNRIQKRILITITVLLVGISVSYSQHIIVLDNLTDGEEKTGVFTLLGGLSPAGG